MRPARLVLGTVGVAVAAYGVILLLTRQSGLQLVEVAVWLAAGVLVHDGLVAVVVILAALVVRRSLAPPWRAPATVALVVWGSVSLMAVPVLGRFGARADNPTLLDRPYLTSWLLATVATVVAVAVAGLLRRRSGASS